MAADLRFLKNKLSIAWHASVSAYDQGQDGELKMRKKANIVMLGTAPDALGGIASVIGTYYASGIIDNCNITYLVTHCTGTVQQKISTLFKAWCTFIRIILKGKIKIVHMHLACGMSFWRKSLFAAYAALLKIPFVIHLHSGNFPQYYLNSSKLTRLIIRCMFRLAAANITVSKELKLWLEQISNIRPAVIIHNPICIPAIRQASARKQSTIVFVGRIEPAKGIIDLITAVQHISQSYPEARLVIAGAGDTATVKKMAADLGIGSKIDFPGWVTGETKSALLTTATLFVLPSYAEGMPMGVLEAMSHGTAVIASDVGGIPEAIHDGIEGLLVPPGNVLKLVEAITLLLCNRELRERLGRAGQEAVRQRFSTASTSAALSDLYARLLS